LKTRLTIPVNYYIDFFRDKIDRTNVYLSIAVDHHF